MKQADILWLAGLLEGEGCFSQRRSGRPRVSVEMTDRDVVERVAELFGTSVSVREPRVTGKCDTCGRGPNRCGVATAYRRGEEDEATIDDVRRFGFTVRQESYQTETSGVKAERLMRTLYPLMGDRRRARILEILGSIL